MTSYPVKMDLEASILSLVKVFIERQLLVSNVIKALRLDIFIIMDNSVTDMVVIEMAQKYADVPQIGVWQNDEGAWDYYFHGNGCRLTHCTTREVLDWDAPDVYKFDPWKFMYWLKWAFETKPDYLVKEIQIISNVIKLNDELETVVNSILHRLTDENVLEQSSQGKLHFK